MRLFTPLALALLLALGAAVPLVAAAPAQAGVHCKGGC